MRTARWLLLLGLVCLAVLCWPVTPMWATGWTERVSVASDGTEADGDASRSAVVSADGRYVAFHSFAVDLVPGDTNLSADVFRHDRLTGITERVSVASDGTEANGASVTPSISGDGRYVAFYSQADNLVPGDTNGCPDVFVHDCLTGVTERVSVRSDGGEASYSDPSSRTLLGRTPISADGRFVAFNSYAANLVSGDTNNDADVFIHDRLTGVTERVSVAGDGAEGDGRSEGAEIAADGRYVAFCSGATNLVSGDTNGFDDVFLRDRLTGETERANVSSSGEQGNETGGLPYGGVSTDGRYVLFPSLASNLVPGDTNGVVDVFIHDRVTGETERVSVASDGSQGNANSGWEGLSADCRYVAFASSASNLVPGDTNGDGIRVPDVFVRDRLTGETERVSVSSDGTQANGESDSLAPISADGRCVVFVCTATNLVPGDTNGQEDVFVRVRWPFRDVPPEQWAFSQINACVDASIVKGYADETYLPELEVTRDQMAVFIARAMDGGEPTGPATVAFTDITNPWANVYIAYCVEHGVVKGFDATHYGPSLQVDRGSMAVFIARAKGWVSIDDAMNTAPELFADVPAGYWAGTAIQACVEQGVVKGYDATHYQPTWIVTRDQMAVFVQRAFQLPV